MNVGDYVRTKYGITQYREYDTYNGKLLCMPIHDMTQGFFANLQDIIKSSPNIIDLIEVGDYVNGKKVIDTYNDYIFDYSEEFKVIRFSETDILHDVKHIKSIVTKEQFSQMEYKVGE